MNYLNLAVQLALQNPIQARGRSGISRFCAVLTDGRHLFYAYNQYKTHPLQARFSLNPQSIYLHSEVSVIEKAIRHLSRGASRRSVTDLSDFRLYVARVLKDGTSGLAMPCTGCFKAVRYFGIEKVQWTE